MPQRLDVSPNARPEDRFAVVVSKYNNNITERLCDAALTTLTQHGVADDKILVVPVPGSFEIPVIAHRLAHSGQFDAVICLGAVVQGETTHHEYINHQVAGGIRTVAQQSGVPVAFGVLTCQNLELALDRAGGRMGNKGHEAALAALETLATLRTIDDLATPHTAVEEPLDDHNSKSEASSEASSE
ncbi:MAG: 6,7-dimethyl-8-ribityllumazine synthase, partial [Planctomycetota bacterium]|nr:6,7-dimethyl-8-ribityllumazine synthase [Planctomycetota bacterium]